MAEKSSQSKHLPIVRITTNTCWWVVSNTYNLTYNNIFFIAIYMEICPNDIKYLFIQLAENYLFNTKR